VLDGPNGWADAMRRLPVVGRLGAVDRQALHIENVGPYVLARRAVLGRPKAEIISEALGPTIAVVAYPQEVELFKLRPQVGLALPPLVAGGYSDWSPSQRHRASTSGRVIPVLLKRDDETVGACSWTRTLIERWAGILERTERVHAHVRGDASQ